MDVASYGDSAGEWREVMARAFTRRTVRDGAGVLQWADRTGVPAGTAPNVTAPCGRHSPSTVACVW